MGPEGAVEIVNRRELAAAADPAAERARLADEYRARYANPFLAASRGFIDDIIEPRETRPKLIAALEMLQNKRQTLPAKKHGNIPL
jgi:acetyl-CoA carboxylase carboxyltransferase component